MILNVSGRTDVIAFYSEWFKKRYKEGFVDVRKNERTLGFHEFTEKEYKAIGEGFSASAKKHGQTVQTCFEDRNLVEYGFCGEECISHQKAIELTGKDFPEWTARKERKCHCVQMIDIGEYNSCGHRCKYCYTNFNEDLINEQMRHHNPDSTMLIGELTPHDRVTIRKDNALKSKKKASPKTDDAQVSLLNNERHS